MRVDLDVAEGEFVSIIGPNGAGKTTLFNLVTGLDRPDAGTVALDGRDITGLLAGAARRARASRARSSTAACSRNLSVLDNVLVGAHTRACAPVRPGRSPLLGPFARAGAGAAAARRGEGRGGALREEALAILARFGDRLLPRMDNPAYSLSYANRRRVEIARALALRPRLLLLDEPTAGMNQTETAEMQALIARAQGRPA